MLINTALTGNQDATTLFHKAYREAISHELSLAKILALAALEQFNAQGIDAKQHLTSIEKTLAEALASQKESDSLSAIFNTGDPRIDEADIKVSLDSKTIESMGKRVTDAIIGAAPEFAQSLRKSSLQGILKDPDARLLEIDIERDAFIRRLELTWKKPFQLFDIYLALSYELSEAWGTRLRRRRSKRATTIEVIARLHAWGCQVASEVRTLLHNGFADGALSRWRTLHEIAVVALFIGQEGEEVAQRYLAHLDVDSYKSALQYQKAAVLLGHKPLSEKEIDRTYAASTIRTAGLRSSALR